MMYERSMVGRLDDRMYSYIEKYSALKHNCRIDGSEKQSEMRRRDDTKWKWWADR